MTQSAWKAVSSPQTWQKNDSSIYYNAGRVGIGVTNPYAKLDVNGDINIASGHLIK